jgi:hypothetical protein
VEAGGAGGSGGGADELAASPPPIEKGFGALAHFASTAARPELCQDCWLLPRGKLEEGLWAEAVAAAQPRSTATAIVDFMFIPRFEVLTKAAIVARENPRLTRAIVWFEFLCA